MTVSFVTPNPKTCPHTAFVFPGQGSQKAGMLAEVYQMFPQVRECFAEANEALGIDLWQIAQGDERLNQTAFTQPVILTASVALWRLWQALGGVQPRAVAGHSLGEYSALVAAEVLSLSDAVRLVHARGQFMQDAVPVGTGAMAAIIGLDDAVVMAGCQHISQATGQVVEAANFNAVGQVVIAGTTDAVQQTMTHLKAQGAKAIALPVSVPSHCALMQPAARQLAEQLQHTTFHQAAIPVVQNAHAAVATDVDAIRQALIDQLCQPVRWTQSMQVLSEMQVKWLVECGPGNVLSNLAKRMPQGFTAYPIDSQSRIEDALAVLVLAEGKLT
ncbi:MAG: ACP S-malonyltransferase [Pseudomonadota bacterium]|nr:ACP S-malonyltransferase [Pseudomonadota bacterium]